MARGRQLSAYIDEDGEDKLNYIKESVVWDGSDSKLLLKLLDFAVNHIDDWSAFIRSGISAKDRDANIYKVMIALVNKEIEANMESIDTFLKGGSS